MTCTTSCSSSGSSAEVGSSNKSASGSMHSARAMAARCCCPPERCGEDQPFSQCRPFQDRQAPRVSYLLMPMTPVLCFHWHFRYWRNEVKSSETPSKMIMRMRKTCAASDGVLYVPVHWWFAFEQDCPVAAYSRRLAQRKRVDFLVPEGADKSTTRPVLHSGSHHLSTKRTVGLVQVFDRNYGVCVGHVSSVITYR